MLSEAAQAQFGFCKDVRAAKVWLKDYDNESLPLARAAGSGLIITRIDHLLASKEMTGLFPAPIRHLAIEASTQDSEGSEDDSSAETFGPSAFPATRVQIDVPDDAMLMVSLGLRCFEHTDISEGRSYAVTEFCNENLGQKTYGFRPVDPRNTWICSPKACVRTTLGFETENLSFGIVEFLGIQKATRA